MVTSAVIIPVTRRNWFETGMSVANLTSNTAPKEMTGPGSTGSTQPITPTSEITIAAIIMSIGVIFSIREVRGLRLLGFRRLGVGEVLKCESSKVRV